MNRKKGNNSRREFGNQNRDKLINYKDLERNVLTEIANEFQSSKKTNRPSKDGK